MGRLAEALCKKHLFTLTLAVLLQTLVKLVSGKIKLPQNSPEQRFIKSRLLFYLRQRSSHFRRILADNRNLQAASGLNSSLIRLIDPCNQLQNRRLPAAIRPFQSNPVSPPDFQRKVFQNLTVPAGKRNPFHVNKTLRS